MNAENQKSSGWGNDEKLFLGIVIALAAVVGLGSWFMATALSHRDELHGIQPDKPRQLENFSLTDRTGRTVTRRELDGKILAVSFLFTSCSLTCPEVSRHMAEIQRLTADQPDVRLLSLTVDPRTDTPPVLARWGARFDADTNRWWLLTGDKPVFAPPQSAAPGRVGSITLERRGGIKVPITLWVRLENREEHRITWDGQDRWVTYDFESPVAAAVLDPDGNYPMLKDRLHASYTRNPSRRGFHYWSQMVWGSLVGLLQGCGIG